MSISAATQKFRGFLHSRITSATWQTITTPSTHRFRRLSTTASKLLTSRPSTQPSQPKSQLRAAAAKRYNSSIQGTIAKGEAGIPDSTSPSSSLAAPEHLNEKEKEIWGILQKELKPTKLEVQDISGGCGSMYGIEVVSERFRGLGMLKQQRLVNQVLGEEIKGWHGVQLRTSAP